MELEEEPLCRICVESAQYNLFNDELAFENRSMKIYIVLNNFIFEKLYGPDEFSEFICNSCCNSLYNSYQFMLKVRDSEHKLRTEGPPPKKLKDEIRQDNITIQLSTVSDIHTVIATENVILGEDILETEYSEEDFLPTSIDVEVKRTSCSTEKLTENRKRTKRASHQEFADFVTITNYSLVYKEENNHLTAKINIEHKLMDNSGDEEFMLEKWLENQQPASVYSCSYCVKGFSNTDFLLKHISSCHLCLTCFKICENNKDLSQHMKIHSTEKLVCPFCGKVCTYNIYRPHIRKQHVSNMPYYIGVLPQNIVPCNVD